MNRSALWADLRRPGGDERDSQSSGCGANVDGGGKVTLIVSALLRHGISHLRVLEQGLKDWLMEHEYTSISELRSVMSQLHCPDPSAFERVQYMKTLQTYHSYWVAREESVGGST